MTAEEFSNEFDVLYNNITSNQAPGLDEYEKSVFLTKALRLIILEYLNPVLNKVLLGYDGSPKRLIDFSKLTVIENLLKQYIGPFNEAIPELQELYVSANLSEFKITVDYEDAPNDHILTPLLAALEGLIKGNPFRSLQTYVLGTEVEALYEVMTVAADHPIIKVTTPFFITTFMCNKKPWMCNDDVVAIGKTKTGRVSLNRVINGAVNSSADILLIEVNRLDDRSIVYKGPSILPLYILNERLLCKKEGKSIRLTVVPLSFMEYTILMSKPYKWPLKNLAWRLIQSTTYGEKYEIITPYSDNVESYTIRYVKTPMPIILRDLSISDLSIEGYYGNEDFYKILCCEIPEILHEPVLQRAVELAKASYVGDLNSQLALGTNSQTEIGMVSTSKQ